MLSTWLGNTFGFCRFKTGHVQVEKAGVNGWQFNFHFIILASIKNYEAISTDIYWYIPYTRIIIKTTVDVDNMYYQDFFVGFYDSSLPVWRNWRLRATSK